MSEPVQTIVLRVNGEPHRIAAPTRATLADVLRDLGFTGVHLGCEHGVCGACTIRIDGVIVRGCLMLAVQAVDTEIETVEHLSVQPDTHDLVEAFVAENALQCGFCTPGMVISASALLDETSAPTREEVRAYLSGNYCRCTGYQAIVEAVMRTAEERRRAKGASK